MRSGAKLIDNSERGKATAGPRHGGQAFEFGRRGDLRRMTIHFLFSAFKRLSADANQFGVPVVSADSNVHSLHWQTRRRYSQE